MIPHLLWAEAKLKLHSSALSPTSENSQEETLNKGVLYGQFSPLVRLPGGQKRQSSQVIQAAKAQIRLSLRHCFYAHQLIFVLLSMLYMLVMLSHIVGESGSLPG